MSGHERKRLEILRSRIIELGAVRKEQDVFFNGMGALVWIVDSGEHEEDMTVVYFDGHSDTVDPLPEQWRARCGIDPWEGPGANFEGAKVEFLQKELEFIPARSEWSHLLFGRGAADQLAGVVTQVFATRALLRMPGALKGIKVVSIATVSEEDNDGGTPLWIMENEWAKSTGPPPPDCVVITEATGDVIKGPLGVYRGQRGRVQVELLVGGKSCHGSMPHLGLNPVEFAANIVVEATQQASSGSFARDLFLGAGTRTCSWGKILTPSDCAVPQQMILRFDRRLTMGETAEAALLEIETLPAVKVARDAGLVVEIRIPTYDEASNSGARLHNPQQYRVWSTPEDHLCVKVGAAAHEAIGLGACRIDSWVFSTDGVGYVIDDLQQPWIPSSWIRQGPFLLPPMIGIGPGREQHAHRIGEYVDMREVVLSTAMLTVFTANYRKSLTVVKNFEL